MTGELSDRAPLVRRFGPREQRVLHTALAPWRAYTDPRYFGLENIPAEGPALLVGNHTLLGLLDAPLMAAEIVRVTGRTPRGLAEKAHYAIPGWRDLLGYAGAVRGTRDNCRALFGAGELVLVFPGGGREVAKRKGERYRLIWKERMGFARMAIEAGCPIVPFSAIGVEDMYDVLLDADHPVLKPVRAVAERAGFRWELAPPLVRGIGPTPLPRRERIYFSFGAPVETASYGLADADVRAVRDEVRAAVEDGIAWLLDERERERRG